MVSIKDVLRGLFHAEESRLRTVLNKWRLLFLGFALVYTLILLFNLTKTPIQWDEVSHLNGGSLLYFGFYGKFVGNAFYPPLFDALTFISFKVFGISLFTGRLFSVVFAILSLWAVFELAHYMYDGKVALLSAVMLGLMPGFFWLSGCALLETALMFFVMVSLLCFYRWLTVHQDRMLVLSGLALGLGFLVKYQMLIAGVIMLLSIFLLARKQLKFAFKNFSLTIATAVVVVIPWVAIAYQVYKNALLDQWLYALQVGNPARSVYSTRFPVPLFYFIEMVWPYSDFHPISVFLYVLGLAGLVLMVWRHRREDKFILLWFAVIFVFFTFISNREWRYVTPLFPVLAISASTAILTLGGALRNVQKKSGSVGRKRLVKAASVVLVVAVAGAMFYSVYDTYSFISRQHITVDIKGATNYAFTNMAANKSIMVMCPFNIFNQNVVQFYLWEKGDRDIEVFQYPFLPVDAYTPNFDITEFIEQCRQYNVQYVFIYEYGDVVPYYAQLCDSGNFTHITDEQTFGVNPQRIFILNFTG